MNWNEKYRPKKFYDVRGQDHAARLVAGFAKGRAQRKSLGLYGAVGNGKTSLVRLFAQALNCEQIEADGSPCQACAACLAPENYLKEYNTPAFADDEKSVRLILEAENRSPTDSRFKVLFFDEAHALGKKAQDLLLKPVEDPAEGVFFCFATTERDRLRPALRSRLFPISIKPILPADAVGLLERIATAEGLSYDLPAFYLLVAALPPHARDLVNGLEKLHTLNKHVDLELVKDVFELSVCDRLAEYVLALADQDHGAQSAAAVAWRDENSTKVSWIKRFLITVYYNDVVGQKVVIDPLCYSMGGIRDEFTRRLCARLGAQSPRGLAPFIEKLLAFWAGSYSNDNDASTLRLALFEILVNGERPGASAKAHASATDNIFRPVHSMPAEMHAEPDWESLAAAKESQFIERGDVQQIINRASYLTQQYGVFVNASYRIRLFAREEEDQVCAASILRCCKELAERFFGDEKVDAMLLVERENDFVVGHLAAHISNSLPHDERGRRLQEWVAGAGSYGIEIDEELAPKGAGFEYHWRAVLNLCSGYDDGDAASTGGGLRGSLGIPTKRWRHPGPMNSARLFFSQRLRSIEIAAGSENGMAAPSAFDAGAWSEVISGWELHEYWDRCEEIECRRRLLADVRAMYRHDKHAGEQEVSKKLAWWCSLAPGTWARSWPKEW